MIYTCAHCGTILQPGTKYHIIEWEIAPRDWFCNYDCILDYMSSHNIKWATPNAQPDV